MSDSHIHSTGRGGAGNIGPDSTIYVDGDIVREGVAGEPGHSSGRGGAGNVVPSPRHGTPIPKSASTSPAVKAAPGAGGDIIPEPAMREQTPNYDDFHTGRGGQGNVHRDKFGGHSTKKEMDAAGHHVQPTTEKEKKEGLLEKAKHAIGLDKKKEGSA